MSKSKQLDVGNEVEIEVGKIFKNNGYWAKIFPKKVSGQPVDIIAIKNKINWLVDAKHLREESKSFPFSRIEANQKDALRYAKEFAHIENLGFVICCGEDLTRGFFLSYDKLVELEEKGFKSVKISELEDFQEVLDKCEQL